MVHKMIHHYTSQIIFVGPVLLLLILKLLNIFLGQSWAEVWTIHHLRTFWRTQLLVQKEWNHHSLDSSVIWANVNLKLEEKLGDKSLQCNDAIQGNLSILFVMLQCIHLITSNVSTWYPARLKSFPFAFAMSGPDVKLSPNSFQLNDDAWPNIFPISLEALIEIWARSREGFARGFVRGFVRGLAEVSGVARPW